MANAPARTRPGGLDICVFCGARLGNSAAVVTAARELGTLLGEAGHRLIYGGGGTGLMGEVAWAGVLGTLLGGGGRRLIGGGGGTGLVGVVAWAAYRGGAQATGITPRFLHAAEAAAAPPQDLRLTATLAERKEHMLRLADGFL